MEALPFRLKRPSDEVLQDVRGDTIDRGLESGRVLGSAETGDIEDTAIPRLPRRQEDLHVEELDGEAVVYDPQTGAVHRLNATTLEVWNCCNGSRTPRDIASGIIGDHSIPLGEASRMIGSVIGELHRRGLLEPRGFIEDQSRPSAIGAPTSPTEAATTRIASDRRQGAANSARRGSSRREFLNSGVAKGVLAAPVISTFIASGAFASSGNLPNGTSFDPTCADLGSACTEISQCCDYGGYQLECDTSTCSPGKCCCVKATDGPCTVDADCCDLSKHCVAGGPAPTFMWCN